MTPVHRRNQQQSVVYYRCSDAKTTDELDATFEAYEVEELTERDLRRYFEEITAEQSTSEKPQSADPDEAAIEDG